MSDGLSKGIGVAMPAEIAPCNLLILRCTNVPKVAENYRLGFFFNSHTRLHSQSRSRQMSHVAYKAVCETRRWLPNLCVPDSALYHENMSYPIKTCVVCGEQFELKPGKPGFANRCPDCSEAESTDSEKSSDPLKSDRGANAARREAMRNLLYRKDR